MELYTQHQEKTSETLILLQQRLSSSHISVEEGALSFDHFYLLPLNKCLILKSPAVFNKKQNNQSSLLADGISGEDFNC